MFATRTFPPGFDFGSGLLFLAMSATFLNQELAGRIGGGTLATQSQNHKVNAEVPTMTEHGYHAVGLSMTIGSRATASAGGIWTRKICKTAIPQAMLSAAVIQVTPSR